ncbi:phenazine biosynthesis protein PhzF family [Acinetobacter marinus]|uniref:Phenazine biosynthesis protein PhzF family n=1 Tax=Acinetobacter marinus TaxID=281375 RepID=A0A1G6KZ33_9GAMM|nr:PhzF family phenazine biosynthesis protein [Acinetobacter marinus]SDC36068.1 phenazine biosynthesis protein PhzF family [Acinetobacter marinus]
MKMYQVDAFAQQLFQGNPAAVLILEEWLDDNVMQNIAQENNLAETAFVKKQDERNFEIRWFTPVAEVDFCGHATLASAFVLFQLNASLKQLSFHVRKLGEFIIHQADDGKIHMNFPIRRAEQIDNYPAELRAGLSKPFKAVYLSPQAYIIEYASVQDVLDEQPDFAKLKTLGKLRTAITASNRDVAITAQGIDSYAEFDCVSRYFAPAMGIDEDPVTGSIHTGIVPMWADRLNKTELVAYQASKRGGTLYCKILDDERMEISGYAKLYMVAEIFPENE